MHFYSALHSEEGSLHSFFNSRDSAGSSALAYAVFYKNEAIVKLLLQHIVEFSLGGETDVRAHQNS